MTPEQQRALSAQEEEKRLVQVSLAKALMKLVDKYAIDADLKRGPAMERLLWIGLKEIDDD